MCLAYLSLSAVSSVTCTQRARPAALVSLVEMSSSSSSSSSLIWGPRKLMPLELLLLLLIRCFYSSLHNSSSSCCTAEAMLLLLLQMSLTAADGSVLLGCDGHHGRVDIVFITSSTNLGYQRIQDCCCCCLLSFCSFIFFCLICLQPTFF